jgi:hypothetical protein
MISVAEILSTSKSAEGTILLKTSSSMKKTRSTTSFSLKSGRNAEQRYLVRANYYREVALVCELPGEAGRGLFCL